MAARSDRHDPAIASADALPSLDRLERMVSGVVGAIEKEVGDLPAQLRRLNRERDELQSALEASKAGEASARSAIARLDDDKATLSARLAAQADTLQERRTEIAGLKAELRETQRASAALEKLVASLKKEILGLQKIAELREATAKKAEEARANSDGKLAGLRGELAALKKQATATEQRLGKQEKQASELRKAQDEAAKRLKQEEDRASAAQKKLEEANARMKAFRESLSWRLTAPLRKLRSGR